MNSVSSIVTIVWQNKSPLILNITWFRMSLVKEFMNMKKINVALAILFAAVMAGNAQTNSTNQPVYSDIVGYSKVSVPFGTRADHRLPIERKAEA